MSGFDKTELCLYALIVAGPFTVVW